MQETFSVEQVRQADRQLLAAGEPLMERAAYAVATSVLRTLKRARFRRPGSTVLTLVGSGNNGGDALYASAYLARRGLQVNAVIVSGVHQVGLRAAINAGVRVIESPTEEVFRKLARGCRIWIDGMLGIGARGEIRQPFANWIRILSAERDASSATQKIFAVDIPSGIVADSGQLLGDVLPADVTITMGCLKPGLLLPPAAQLCGEIEVADLGYQRVLLPAKPTSTEKSAAFQVPKIYRLSQADLTDLIYPPLAQDHKYSRGVLSVNTGSAQYPGAGVLSVGAALRTGLGMLRYMGGAADQVRAADPEVVSLAGKSDAWLIGSGVTDLNSARSSYRMAAAQQALVILDAGAIELLANERVSTPTIITPHAGELAKLMQNWSDFASLDTPTINRNPARYALLAAEKTGAIVVLKGSITLIATPENQLFAQGPATSWLATAGSGDVLGGIIAALAANWKAAVCHDKVSESLTLGNSFQLAKIAAGGVLIHALAGASAAFGQEKSCSSGHPITASDTINAIVGVMHQALNMTREVKL